ncbi:hypothetical protein KCTCHS21_18920 [Cohnella abietis]|uniref:Phage protein n=1 Tax=Cohnella abietis TaxID=2507935 RepID=A0A3T1D310_9BACL|nr:hypothetical protein KCTCHS21_18920 [Cohnella abietis]
MLPQITQLMFDNNEETATETVHKTFDWDFDVGDFRTRDGRIVELEGLEYLKVWIQKAIRTVRDTLIYDGEDYGSEHTSLIGRNFNKSFAQSEYERMIREALVENDAISGVENFAFGQAGSRLEISFDVRSIYGDMREAVLSDE